MKTRLSKFSAFLSVLGLAVWAVAPGFGQAPVIASFGQNGLLAGTNLLPGTTASVEWASSPLGPWTNSWAGLETVTADSNGTLRVSVPMFYRVRGFPVPSNMVWIPPGTFTMGSPETEAMRASDETQHAVTISRGFWMGRHEVTQGEYLDVVGSNPSYFRNGTPPYGGTGGPVTNELVQPVEQVTWIDATNYCALLTERERLAGRLPVGYKYRLPTEAQWEYACRAGTTTSHHNGDELRSGMANFDGKHEYDASIGAIDNPEGIYVGRATEVGSYAPNAWGLHDMHGNVYEWCADWYGTYPGGDVTDPLGAATGADRLFRGGAWQSFARDCRSALRNSDSPVVRSAAIGFRVVLARVQP